MFRPAPYSVQRGGDTIPQGVRTVVRATERVGFKILYRCRL